MPDHAMHANTRACWIITHAWGCVHESTCASRVAAFPRPVLMAVPGHALALGDLPPPKVHAEVHGARAGVHGGNFAIGAPRALVVLVVHLGPGVRQRLRGAVGLFGARVFLAHLFWRA